MSRMARRAPRRRSARAVARQTGGRKSPARYVGRPHRDQPPPPRPRPARRAVGWPPEARCVKVAVITDSASSLAPDIAAEHNVTVVPLHLMVGGEVVTNGDLGLAEVVARWDEGIT